MEEQKHKFITYLTEKREHTDKAHSRSVMAALRRGLGLDIGEAPEMYPYVVPWLPKEPTRNQERSYYLIASLFAQYTEREKKDGTGSMGSHFAKLKAEAEDATAIERRFTNLLAAHPEELPVYLRQAVGILKAKEVPIDWHRLFRDISGWHYPSRYIQQQWARDFWSPAPEKDADSGPGLNSTQTTDSSKEA